MLHPLSLHVAASVARKFSFYISPKVLLIPNWPSPSGVHLLIPTFLWWLTQIVYISTIVKYSIHQHFFWNFLLSWGYWAGHRIWLRLENFLEVESFNNWVFFFFWNFYLLSSKSCLLSAFVLYIHLYNLLEYFKIIFLLFYLQVVCIFLICI